MPREASGKNTEGEYKILHNFIAKNKVFPLTRTYVMGILNVTPDSFSDGGKYLDPEKALARALEMEKQGADIIDIGGQSTRPGYEAIPREKEWERIGRVVEAVVKGAGIAVSVDTFYPWVAERALAAGADIINDVSGFGEDMLRAVAGSGCGCVIMHPCGAKQGDILSEVKAFFEERLERAQQMGVAQERVCFDPGVGFGKTYEDNLRLIAHVERAKLPGTAYLMAASRKRVTGMPCGNPPFEERLAATLAAHTAAVLGGADMVRAHDVKEALQAARMADALKAID
ncbi:dihydropteroate synthase [Acutalibacter muris]|uniref:Dihydropteroate synthase n=2 Tax=Acutalibacter muris TaxID=1796620 RepID=A0A1Z2XVH5_9FIRM|nr:dihydropteroate synthase [Hungateiclostridiaceae bacterium KB18]ASB42433.1 dihydropteroate synthase [Acutalibacter muris]QQR31721.1 dihydropteroate synthase [Acutalibacter muris]